MIIIFINRLHHHRYHNHRHLQDRHHHCFLSSLDKHQYRQLSLILSFDAFTNFHTISTQFSQKFHKDTFEQIVDHHCQFVVRQVFKLEKL